MNTETDNQIEVTDANRQNPSIVNDAATAQLPVPAAQILGYEALQAIKRKNFPSTALDAGQLYVTKALEVAAANQIDPVFNFDIEDDFPTGYGLAVIPLTESITGHGFVTKGLAIAAIPDYATVANDPAGVNWIQSQITAAMLRQIASAAKSKTGQLTSIPFKVADFATSSRSSALAGFNHVATLFVAALKKKGLDLMSKAFLRQILASSSFAEQQYPRLPQKNWVAVLNSMINHAEKDNVDVTGLRNWLKTRDTETVNMADVDLSDIDAMV